MWRERVTRTFLIVPNIGWATALGPSCITPKHSVRSLPNGGADQVIIGEQNDWEEAAEGTDRKGPTKDVNLWMDSTDFALRGPCEDGKKDQYHSYKLDSKGRYQGIMDSNTRFRALYGGYSPKVHDSQFCEINKHSIKKDFKGGVIVADQHYQKFGRTCSDPKFVTPVRSPNKKKKKKKTDITVTTEEIKKKNEQIRAVRAKVELPFAILEKKFKVLGKKFAEGEDQLDHLVTFAVGVHNASLK